MDESLRPERTRRLGVDSSSIQLADGNRWGFALPRPRLRPVVVREVDDLGRPVEKVQVATEFGYPLATRKLIDDLRIACGRGTAESQHEAFFRLATSLVRLAHDIELNEVVGLLEMDLDELPGFVDAVLAIVFGERLETTDSPRKKEPDV